MPAFKDQLSEEQIMQLVAYIKSLGQNEDKEDPVRMRNSYVPKPPATPEMNGLLTK
jgi:mono/diheme cytochrome c family protein